MHGLNSNFEQAAKLTTAPDDECRASVDVHED